MYISAHHIDANVQDKNEMILNKMHRELERLRHLNHDSIEFRERFGEISISFYLDLLKQVVQLLQRDRATL